MSRAPIRAFISEGEPFSVRLQLENGDPEPALYTAGTDFSAITYKAWDQADPTTLLVAETSLTPASVISAPTAWDQDSIGFNFAKLFSDAAILAVKGGHTAILELKFVDADTYTFFVPVILTIEAIQYQ